MSYDREDFSSREYIIPYNNFKINFYEKHGLLNRVCKGSGTDADYGKCPYCGGTGVLCHTFWLGDKPVNEHVCGNCYVQQTKGDNVIYKIAIDADSLIYKSLYRHQDIWESNKNQALENSYAEFCGEIAKIKGAVFNGPHTYQYKDEVKAIIALSPSKSFRHDIYPEYKANRLGKPTVVQGIKELKDIVRLRLKPVVYEKPKIEADDLVIYLAINKGYMVAAIDKDVLNACPTSAYNYNKFTWQDGRTNAEIEKWYLMQTLMGDKDDNIKGVAGIGEKGAFNIVHGLQPEQRNVTLSFEQLNYICTFDEIVKWFDSEYDAILNHMLVRMDQFDGKEIKLWQRPKEL